MESPIAVYSNNRIILIRHVVKYRMRGQSASKFRCHFPIGDDGEA